MAVSTHIRDRPSDEVAAFRSPNEAWSHAARDPAPRRDYLPLPPSPLGLSNYDALDVEDNGDAFDPYAHLDDEDEPIPNPYEDDDEVPFSPSAVTSSSSTTAYTNNTHATSMFSDFNVLGHEEPVVGDYDQVDEGADAFSAYTRINVAGLSRPIRNIAVRIQENRLIRHVAKLPANLTNEISVTGDARREHRGRYVAKLYAYSTDDGFS
ncbi:hypothetical protein J4E86_002366 [Alternaria arbusti]|uniref:uncharacterized protein n=1 Tax=Alternaria arbusti TaxID=232088 RepID=UPI00221EEADD|nr:uncharacterized protein J4E86_002366 [Alternaria arbusti]KAI4960741.1 hypothetical protein J4E86_002366 [Alternaria arbusti]